MSKLSMLLSVCALLALPQLALAAKPQVITKLPGEAYVVRCNAEGTWASAWVQDTRGQYTLNVINAVKGDRKEVLTTDDPGGQCWIPGKNLLVYCKGKQMGSDKIKYTNVTYFLYDPVKGTNTKITDLKDTLETYILDPIAAEDGNKVFHLTINGKPLPSFNVYFPASNTMSPLETTAKIGSEYDLSSDGATVYWPMTQENGNLVIAGWSIGKNYYSGLYEFAAAKDPAQSRGAFKVDSTTKRAVTMASSEADPTLKACVYSFANPKNPTAIPVNLGAAEDVLYVDWKGRTGQLYFLLYNNQTKQYSVDEYDPVSKARTAITRTADPVSNFLDYASGGKAYFYTTVDSRNPKNPVSVVIKLS